MLSTILKDSESYNEHSIGKKFSTSLQSVDTLLQLSILSKGGPSYHSNGVMAWLNSFSLKFRVRTLSLHRGTCRSVSRRQYDSLKFFYRTSAVGLEKKTLRSRMKGSEVLDGAYPGRSEKSISLASSDIPPSPRYATTVPILEYAS